MQAFCQWLVLLWCVVGFFAAAHSDFHGRTAKGPFGFAGFVITCTVVGLQMAALYGAGAFSVILR